jgi:hypothetical protein
MSREIPAGIASAITEKVTRPIYAVDLLFDSPNQIYLHTGIGNKTFNSITYQGVGDLLKVSAIDETNDLTASGASLKLNGLNSSLLTRALAEPYQNRTCNIYYGEEGNSNLIFLFTGLMDVMQFSDDGEKSTIDLKVESHMIALKRQAVLKYTNESQRARFPNDTGMSYITGLQDQRLEFGKGYQPPDQ